MPKKPQEIQSERVKRTKIRVIGVGGGGGSIVSEIASRVSQASFVVANTDLQALKTVSRKATRFQFGASLTQGLGTGMNPELGQIAAQQEKEKIKKLLEGQDLCILVVCLGGGTGSGAAPIFAKISKSLGNLTYGIFTLPFKFEGEKKMGIAKASLERVRPYLNALSIIPNERIFQIVDKATPLQQALSAINRNLSESLAGLIETIYEPGLINIDFANLKTVLEGRGRLAYLNAVVVPKGEKSPQEAIEKVLNSPLYPYTIRGAKGVLFNIAGEKEINLNEVNQISRNISSLLNKEAKIIFGVSQGRKYQDKIKITLLATGCGMKVFSEKPKRKRKAKKKVVPEPIPMPKPKPRPKQKLKKKKMKKVTPQKPKEVEKIPEEGLERPTPPEKKAVEIRIRKNGLQIKREAEEEEKEMLEKEKFWESPAFLRKRRFFRAQ